MEAEKEREQARPEEEFPLLEQAPAETPAPAEEPEIRAETLVDEIGPDKPKKKREKKPRAEKPEGSAPRSGHGWKIALLVMFLEPPHLIVPPRSASSVAATSMSPFLEPCRSMSRATLPTG